MNASDGVDDSDRQTQKLTHLHGLAEQASDRFATGVIEHQSYSTLVPREREWPDGPSRIELSRERILVLDTCERSRRRIFASGCHDEYTQRMTQRARGDAAVQGELAIVVER